MLLHYMCACSECSLHIHGRHFEINFGKFNYEKYSWKMKQKNAMNANCIVRWMAALKMQAQYVLSYSNYLPFFRLHLPLYILLLSFSHHLLCWHLHSLSTLCLSPQLLTLFFSHCDMDLCTHSTVTAAAAPRCFV